MPFFNLVKPFAKCLGIVPGHARYRVVICLSPARVPPVHTQIATHVASHGANRSTRPFCLCCVACLLDKDAKVSHSHLMHTEIEGMRDLNLMPILVGRQAEGVAGQFLVFLVSSHDLRLARMLVRSTVEARSALFFGVE